MKPSSHVQAYRSPVQVEPGQRGRTKVVNAIQDILEQRIELAKSIAQKQRLIESMLTSLGYCQPFRVGGRLLKDVRGQMELDGHIDRLHSQLEEADCLLDTEVANA